MVSRYRLITREAQGRPVRWFERLEHYPDTCALHDIETSKRNRVVDHCRTDLKEDSTGVALPVAKERIEKLNNVVAHTAGDVLVAEVDEVRGDLLGNCEHGFLVNIRW